MPFTTKCIPLLLLAGLLWGCANRPVRTTCTANFSLLGQGQVQIEIEHLPDDRFNAMVNGTSVRSSASMIEQRIRPQLNLNADPYGQEFSTLNLAEKSLIHINMLLQSNETKGRIDISFDPKQVRRMKIYDLKGSSDKFGGVFLLEAYSEKEHLLGRAFRSVLVAACR